MVPILLLSALISVPTQAQSNYKINVMDQFSLPVSQALVLIGDEQGQPFSNNFLTTDAGGELQIPSAWKSSQPVTIDAPGFVRQTILNQNPQNLKVYLKSAYLNPQIFISGIIKDLPVVNKDKLIDFSVVLTTFNQNDFIHINQEQFISPYPDQLSVMGKTGAIFSNVSLPEQKENYIIPITITKPTYTLFLNSSGSKKIISMSGRFPFKQVADDLKNGKSFFDVINYFEILNFGKLDIQINKNTPGVDFSGITVPLPEKITIVAPAIANDEQALVLPMNSMNQFYIPSGIKKLDSSESANFNTLDHANVSLLAMIKRKKDLRMANDQLRMSASFVKALDPTAAIYLPIMDDPEALSMDPVKVITKPLVAPSGLYASGMMGVLAEIFETSYNQQAVKIVNPQWEVFALNWEHRVQLPKWPLDLTLPKALVKTFEMTYFAQGQPVPNKDVKSMLDHATHLTKAVVNLQ